MNFPVIIAVYNSKRKPSFSGYHVAEISFCPGKVACSLSRCCLPARVDKTRLYRSWGGCVAGRGCRDCSTDGEAREIAQEVGGCRQMESYRFGDLPDA